MNEKYIATSLFKQKHVPLEVQAACDVRYVDKIEKLKQSKSNAVIETAKQTVDKTLVDQVTTGGVIFYPGRHPEDRHPMNKLCEREIALYRLEESPWNDAVVQYAMHMYEILMGQRDAPPDTYYHDDFKSVGRMEINHKSPQIVGVVGAGNIGARVAEEYRNKGAEVFYHTRGNKSNLDAIGCINVHLHDIFHSSDVVINTLPRTKETHGIIGQSVLASMKQGAVFISIAAGGVVNEQALIHAMCNRPDIRVGLDTFENEDDQFAQSPFNKDNTDQIIDFVREGRLLLTPHIAYRTGNSTAKLVHTLTWPLISLAQRTAYPDIIDVMLPDSLSQDGLGQTNHYPLHRVI